MPALILLVPLFTGIADIAHMNHRARPAPPVWATFQQPMDFITLVQIEPEQPKEVSTWADPNPSF